MLLVGLGFVLGSFASGQTTSAIGAVPPFAPVLILVGGRCTWRYFGGMNHKQENLADEVDGTEGHIALGKNRLLGYNSSLSKKCWPRLSGSAGNTENESGNSEVT